MEFGVYLSKLIEKKRYSYRQLATLADMDHTYVSKIVSGKMGPPSPEILKRLARPLGVSYEDLMCAAGYLNNPSNNEGDHLDLAYEWPEGAKVLFRARNKLTPEQQRKMLRLIETYIQEEEDENE